jgi:hypothetical protein
MIYKSLNYKSLKNGFACGKESYLTLRVTNRKKKQGAPAAAEASTSHLERAREPGVKYASYPLGVHKMAP